MLERSVDTLGFDKAKLRTWAEVDLDAIVHNFQLVRGLVGSSRKIMSVIKSDAYGHGAAAVAKRLIKEGTDYFAVADLDEALELRQNGIDIPILILGYTDPRCASVLAKNKIEQTVFCKRYAKELSDSAALQNCSVTVHIKADTGMNRIGFACQCEEIMEDCANEIEEAVKYPCLSVKGIFTHFAISDEPKKEFTKQQFERFIKLIHILEIRGVTFPLRHCANSAAIINFPETYLDMVRPGIMLYGLAPSPDSPYDKLKPAMTIKSTIAFIKTLKCGQTVSYGRTYCAEKDLKVAAIPIGYADGYPTAMSSKGKVIVSGRRTSVLGRVCMDQMIVDISDIDASQGQTVTVMGTEGDETVSADEIALIRGCINYEVVCGVARRIPRVYYENGNQVFSVNYLLKE
ncbi:MAG: alanine racemase [Bacillota bacterium]|nr:alanine racemase [Bacillota bacterium]